MKRDWRLGFLGFLAFQGIPGIIHGDWVQAIWIVWFVWFINFIPNKKERVILVDAVGCFVSSEGKIFGELRILLDSYPNRKIIMTGADYEKFQKFGLDKAPYEVFTLKHNPEKTDPKYFEIFLKNFRLDRKEVVYFEHNSEAVKSAEKAGIISYFYDNEKKDLAALKKFLDEKIK